MSYKEKIQRIYEDTLKLYQEAIDLIKQKYIANPKDNEGVKKYGLEMMEKHKKLVNERGPEDLVRDIGRVLETQRRPGLGYGRYFGEFCTDNDVFKALDEIEHLYQTMDLLLTEEEKQEVLKIYLERKAKGEYEQKK